MTLKQRSELPSGDCYFASSENPKSHIASFTLQVDAFRNDTFDSLCCKYFGRL